MLGVIAESQTGNDPTTYKAAVPAYLESIGDGIRGLRIGIDRGYATDGVDEQVVAALVEAERVLVGLGRNHPRGALPRTTESSSVSGSPCARSRRRLLRLTPIRRGKSEYGPDLAALIEQGGLATKGTEIARINLERLRFFP